MSEFVWLVTFTLIVEIDEAIYSKRNPVTLEAATALLDGTANVTA
jgi:hypothetical protein